MALFAQLEQLKKDPANHKQIKRFLLANCQKLQRFRCNPCLSRNLLIAYQFIENKASEEQMHRAEWEIEGMAFGVEYGICREDKSFALRPDKYISRDLRMIRISTGLDNRSARHYLKDIAYFIDRVFCFVQSSRCWFFKAPDERFLCRRLFQRFFNEQGR